MMSRFAPSSGGSGHSVARTLGESAGVTLTLLLNRREMAAPLARSDGAFERFRTFAWRAVVPVVSLLALFAAIVAMRVWEVL